MKNIHKKTYIELSNVPNITNYPESWVKIYFKQYPRFNQIKLPKPTRMFGNLGRILKTRESKRTFLQKKVDIIKLSNLIYYSLGIVKGKSTNDTRRTYPSAGARYPIELYLSINDFEGIENGLYHYDVLGHSLELMIKGDERKNIFKFVKQEMVLDAQISFFLTGVFNRTQVKYGIRGYRYVLLDAGHIAQNFYLVSTDLGLGCCTIGGFTDKTANDYLDLNENEQLVYMGVIG